MRLRPPLIELLKREAARCTLTLGRARSYALGRRECWTGLPWSLASFIGRPVGGDWLTRRPFPISFAKGPTYRSETMAIPVLGLKGNFPMKTTQNSAAEGAWLSELGLPKSGARLSDER